MFDPAGNRSVYATLIGGRPDAFVINSAGDMFVGDRFNGYIYRFLAGNASSPERFATGLGDIQNLLFGPDGYIYVGVQADGTIRRVAPDGSVESFATGLPFSDSSGVIGLAFAEDGTLYASDNEDNSVYRIDADGSMGYFSRDPALLRPSNLLLTIVDDVAAVPEPGTLSLMGAIGLLGLAGRRRRTDRR